MGRVKLATRNIAFGYIGNVVTGLLSFVLRTVFIRYLGRELSGVNDLYTSILTVLSMAELGIGTALNYSLYAPVARNEIEKIKSYMRFYRKTYYIIGGLIAVAGIGLSPFLSYLVTLPDGVVIGMKDLTLYYFIFLFNTVSTYFVSYKYSLVNADQKNYIQTNVITITKIITVVVQITVIVSTRSFYWFLLSAAGIELAQKLFVSRYLDRLYPYLKDLKNGKAAPLSKEQTGVVITKTKALMLHKIGDTARLQTDNMIISAMINTALVNDVGNYNLVISFVSNFVNIIFNSVMSGFGNLITTESKDKQYRMFLVYRFFACWIYGFSAVGFFILLSPLVSLWMGEAYVLEMAVTVWIVIEYYFKGDRIVLSNFKTAAGVFEQDRYLPLVQGIVNLVLSVGLVGSMGLKGIFIGTVLSGLIANFVRPFVIYRVCFDRKATGYFIDWLKYLAAMVPALLLCALVKNFLMREVTILRFGMTALAITIIFNGVFIAFFYKSEEFRYLWNLLRTGLRRQ